MQEGKLRTFNSLKEYFTLFNSTFKRMMELRKISHEQKISPLFREKLMVAVSSVNKCAYCSFLHTKTALEQGIPQNEIDDLLKNDIKQFSKEDLPAILFAQHFSETKGNVSESVLKNVIQIYGETKTRQMQAYIQSVLFGNLCCNTYVSFKKKLLTPKEKKKLRWVYIFSFPVARMIYKKSGLSK